MHAVRSCLPLLRIPKAVGHFGIRGHWVKQQISLVTAQNSTENITLKTDANSMSRTK